MKLWIIITNVVKSELKLPEKIGLWNNLNFKILRTDRNGCLVGIEAVTATITAFSPATIAVLSFEGEDGQERLERMCMTELQEQAQLMDHVLFEMHSLRKKYNLSKKRLR